MTTTAGSAPAAEWHVLASDQLMDWDATAPDQRHSDEIYADDVEDELEVRELIARLRADGVDVADMQIGPRSSDDVDWQLWAQEGLNDVANNCLFIEYAAHDRDEYGDWIGWCEMVAGRALVRFMLRVQGAAQKLQGLGVPLSDEGRFSIKQTDVEAFYEQHDQNRNQHPFLYTTALYHRVPGSAEAVQCILSAYCAKVRAAWEADLRLPMTPLPDEEDYLDAGYDSRRAWQAVEYYKQHGGLKRTANKYNMHNITFKDLLVKHGVQMRGLGRPRKEDIAGYRLDAA